VHGILREALASAPHIPGPNARFAQGPAVRTDRPSNDPGHTRKRGKLYRYYVSTDVLKRDSDACPIRRVPAAEIESAVVDQLRGLLRSPEIIVRTWRVAKQSLDGIDEAEVREGSGSIRSGRSYSREQARIVRLLIERVDVSLDGADIRLRTEGLTNLVTDLRAIMPERRRAA